MSANKIAKQPIFWLGTAVIVFAYYSADNAQAQSGVQSALIITSIGVGIAAIIYSVRVTA